MKRFTIAVATLIAAGLLASQAAEAQVARGHVRLPSGAAAGGQIHKRTGPDGGTLIGGRRAARDGHGNAVVGGANCATGAAGQACRAGRTTRTADGTVTHRSGVDIDGANGRALTSTGDFTKSADGAITHDRTTSASGANGSVTIDKSYATGTGRTRTATCANAAGEVVACPTR